MKMSNFAIFENSKYKCTVTLRHIITKTLANIRKKNHKHSQLKGTYTLVRFSYCFYYLSPALVTVQMLTPS